jgi:hypothetical protein
VKLRESSGFPFATSGPSWLKNACPVQFDSGVRCAGASRNFAIGLLLVLLIFRLGSGCANEQAWAAAKGQGRLPNFLGGVRLPGGPVKRQRPAMTPGGQERLPNNEFYPLQLPQAMRALPRRLDHGDDAASAWT